PQNNLTIFLKELKIYGVLVTMHKSEGPNALSELAECIKKGELRYKEEVYDGFDQMPKALAGLFKGDNFGKAIVKASNYP
ncbi:unnamed protein product, partial [Didymodactylos carnosus]